MLALNLSRDQKMHYTLRIAVAMCFIGHGAFGIITKPIWCNYFAVFGIGRTTAFQIMPYVGAVDIILGLVVLLYPIRAIPAWLVIWGTLTALLRPLSGEPFAEFIERAGNYGAPFALLLMSGPFKFNSTGLLAPIDSDRNIDDKTFARLSLCLRVIVFMLLAGHGWLNIIEKKGIINQYSALGFSDPQNLAKAIGLFEIISAFAVLIRPFRPMILTLLLWKIASELFYPQYEVLEWVERGGSYGALLALWFALEGTTSLSFNKKFQPAKQAG